MYTGSQARWPFFATTAENCIIHWCLSFYSMSTACSNHLLKFKVCHICHSINIVVLFLSWIIYYDNSGLIYIPAIYRDLRSTKQGHQGQLVINTSFALLGLYVVFILAGHVTSVRPLCGLMAALLQFFILAYFSWTSVEALLLLFKIVRPLHKFGKYFVLKASFFSWCKRDNQLSLISIFAMIGIFRY